MAGAQEGEDGMGAPESATPSRSVSATVETDQLLVAEYQSHAVHVHDSAGFLGNFLRGDSMDLINDKRYFHGNVIGKRLSAFNKLTVVSSLMLGTSMGVLLKSKHHFDLDDRAFGWFPMAHFEFGAFITMIVVTCLCITATYIMIIQTFYIVRLSTGGPVGFEQAAMFYTNRSICMWRHMAIRCLLNGLMLFMMAVGLFVFVAFHRDAEDANKSPYLKLEVMNAVQALPPPPQKRFERDDVIMGAFSLSCMLFEGALLYYLYYVHNKCFVHHFRYATQMVLPLMQATRAMGARAGLEMHG